MILLTSTPGPLCYHPTHKLPCLDPDCFLSEHLYTLTSPHSPPAYRITRSLLPHHPAIWAIQPPTTLESPPGGWIGVGAWLTLFGQFDLGSVCVTLLPFSLLLSTVAFCCTFLFSFLSLSFSLSFPVLFGVPFHFCRRKMAAATNDSICNRGMLLRDALEGCSASISSIRDSFEYWQCEQILLRILSSDEEGHSSLINYRH